MIRLNSLSINKGSHCIMNNVSLSLPSKGFIAINRQKKSDIDSLFEVVEGIKKPSSGSIIVNGKDIAQFSQSDLDSYHAHTIGFFHSNPDLLISLTSIENVEYQLGQKSNRSGRLKAKEILQKVGFDQPINSGILSLTKENQRRISLARLIRQDSWIILADNPYERDISDECAGERMSHLKELSKTKSVIVGCTDRQEKILSADYCLSFREGKLISGSAPESQWGSQEDTDTKRMTLGLKKKLRLAFRHRTSNPLLLFLSVFLSAIGFSLAGSGSAYLSAGSEGLIAQSILNSGENYIAIKNLYHKEVDGNRTVSYSPFSKKNVEKISSKRKTPFLKAVSSIQNLFPYYENRPLVDLDTAEEKPIMSYYSSAWTGQLTCFSAIDKDDGIPNGDKLLAGRIPNTDSEIRLTDFQFDRIKDTLNKADPSVSDLTYQSILGKEISFYQYDVRFFPSLSIVGILDTSYDPADYQNYKSYCLNGSNAKETPAPESAAAAEKEKLSLLKDQSHINLFFVSQNRLLSVSKTDCKPSSSSQECFFLDEKTVSSVALNPSHLNYLREEGKENIVLFKDSDFSQDNFLSLCLSDYIESIKDSKELTESGNIVIPKKFLESSAKDDRSYPGTSYSFFRNLIAVPIQSYALDHYQAAFLNEEFDVGQYTKNYYLKLKKEIPAIIPENDKLEVYKSYLSTVFLRGRPDYSSEKEVSAFTDIRATAKEMLEYYRNLYSDTIFSKRGFSYQMVPELETKPVTYHFRLSGLVPFYSDNNTISLPTRKQEILEKMYPSDVGDCSSLIVPLFGKGKKEIQQIASLQNKDYISCYRLAIQNPSAQIWDGIQKRQFYCLLFFILSLLFLIGSAFVFYYYFRYSIIGFSIERLYQRKLGTPKKDIVWQSVLQVLILAFLSFLLSTCLRFTLSSSLSSLLASQYTKSFYILPGIVQVLLLLFHSIFLSFFTSLPSLLKLSRELK